jgi:hypothetical protein
MSGTGPSFIEAPSPRRRSGPAPARVASNDPGRRLAPDLVPRRAERRRRPHACLARLSGARKAREKATEGKAGNMKKSPSKRAESPSELIDARIEDLGDWRGEMLSRLRALIKEADPEVVEEWKWRGTPVWSHDGLICTGETYKKVVKMTFAKGASLKDPSGLFNSSLDGNVRRAIDFHEGDKLEEKALKALIRAAVALNKSSARG